jgi:hypothetical protein
VVEPTSLRAGVSLHPDTRLLSHLGRLWPSLKALSVTWMLFPLTDASVHALQPLVGLRDLRLRNNTRITDRSVHSLSSLPRLERLDGLTEWIVRRPG